MNFTHLKSYFVFTKSQRNGIVTLLALVVACQSLLYFTSHFQVPKTDESEKEQELVQAEMDFLKAQKPVAPKVYPFNPNFITDFKGYKLGMSVEEIDRLFAFRKTNKYVNSAEEFQAVTKVSDSLLRVLSPLFKFPDWVKNPRKQLYYHKKSFAEHKPTPVIDINHASADDLIKVYGIGPALSERILKQKELLGGFVAMDQMADVWGLSPEVVVNIKKSFGVLSIPEIRKINVNTASMKELSKFPYFRYPLSKAIVTYRSMNGNLRNADDLSKIPEFPIEKIAVIALYLDF